MFRSLLKWAVLIFLIIESLALIASALELGLKASTSSLGWSRALYGVAALEVILRFAIVGLVVLPSNLDSQGLVF